MIPTLPQAIEVFRDYIASTMNWSTHEGALNFCGEASLAFSAFLNGVGLPAREQAMLGLPDYVRAARLDNSVPEECHVVVEVGDLYIDWTRRQYQPQADYPTITTRAQLEADGWRFVTPEEVERWKATLPEL